MSKFKDLVKQYVPQKVLGLRQLMIQKNNLKKWSEYWNRRAILHGDISNSKEAKAAVILAESHVLQKGIAMPSRKLGFGYYKARSLILHCHEWLNEFGMSDIISFAVSDLKLYLDIHKQQDYSLPEDIVSGITNLTSCIKFTPQEDIKYTKEQFFKACSNFKEFAHSRHSVRNYSEKPVDIEKVLDSIRLAQTAPSACNRQGVRVKIISSKSVKEKVLAIQNGNRGFGALSDKLLLLTYEQGSCEYEYRASGYIDVGIFTMNLLYALHSNNICACTLNAHLTISQYSELRSLIGYKESEIPVVFISIGDAPSEFSIAKSERYPLESICEII